MYKFILFDFDGTLVNTNDLIKMALNQTAKEFRGTEITEEEIQKVFGKPLEIQMKELYLEKYSEMVDYYRKYYKEKRDEFTYEFDGVDNMLKEIKNLGVKMAIVSSKGTSGIKHGIELFKMDDYFEVIVSQDDVENKKPHPEPALKAMEALSANKEETLFVGDSTHDIECAKRAGLKSVLVDWTVIKEDKFKDMKPDYYAKTVDDIVKIVKKEA